MNLSAAEIAALQAGAVRTGLFIRLAVTPPLRCWLGCGQIDVGVNVLDPSGASYSGFGQLLEIPTMQQLLNGEFERVSLQLSGTDDRILELASFQSQVKNKACDIGFGLFNDAWGLLGPVHWTRHYVADYLAMTVTPASDPESSLTVKTATLSIGSLMTGRRRAGLSYFNNQDQQTRSPTDRFCERTPKYSIMAQKLWPKFF